MWQCKWLNLVDNLRTLEVMSPDDQILILITITGEVQCGEACVLTKEDMSSIFSNIAISGLDVNFNNP